MKGIILVLCIIFSIGECKLPMPYGIKACRRSDPYLNQCFERNANQAIGLLANGVPEYNIPSLQPLHWKDSFVVSAPSLKMTLSNILVTGADNFKVSEPHVDLRNNLIQHHISSPEIIFQHRFEAEIRVGNQTDRIEGHSSIAFRNSTWNVTYGYQMQEINGTNYANVTNPHAKVLSSIMDYNFGGLEKYPVFRKPFNNFKRNFVNRDFEQAWGNTIGGFYNNIFNHVPFDEVFTP